MLWVHKMWIHTQSLLNHCAKCCQKESSSEYGHSKERELRKKEVDDKSTWDLSSSLFHHLEMIKKRQQAITRNGTEY